MSEHLNSRVATAEDTLIVQDIFEDAARLPISLGIDQWPASFDTNDVRKYISAGGVHLFQQQGVAMGTVDYRHEDAAIWEVVDNDAAYLHRLAIRRTEQGKGLGERILSWCLERARSEDKAVVRLDCVANNHKLQAYYKHLGFTFVRDVTWQGGQTSLFQYDL